MNAFKLLFTLFTVTFLASVSWSNTESNASLLQISCANSAPIGQGKVELSGSVEIEKHIHSGKISYKRASIWVCNEGASTQCGFQKLTTTDGRYFRKDLVSAHELELFAINQETGNRIILKLVVPGLNMTPEKAQQIRVPSDSFIDLSTKQVSTLSCAAKDLTSVSSARALQLLANPNYWMSFLVN